MVWTPRRKSTRMRRTGNEQEPRFSCSHATRGLAGSPARSKSQLRSWLSSGGGGQNPRAAKSSAKALWVLRGPDSCRQAGAASPKHGYAKHTPGPRKGRKHNRTIAYSARQRRRYATGRHGVVRADLTNARSCHGMTNTRAAATNAARTHFTSCRVTPSEAVRTKAGAPATPSKERRRETQSRGRPSMAAAKARKRNAAAGARCCS